MQGILYDAFICHTFYEADARLSGMIRQELLKYRIPGNVTRKNGIKRISSVYLDQAMDDNEPVSQAVIDALNHSRFLILVCSPNTKSSLRVQQILDYYWHLKNGDYIITIITQGLPDEVFPPLVRQVLRDGALMNVEPLAADISAGYPNIHKCIKLFRTEGLRLIAPIVGCAYDDLRRRHYHSVMNRTYISFSILFALCVYIMLSAFLFIRDVDKKEKLVNSQRLEMEQKLKEATEIAGITSDLAIEYYQKLIDDYLENGTGGESLIEMLRTGQPDTYPDTEEGAQQRLNDLFINASNVAMVLANFRVVQNEDKYNEMLPYFDYLYRDDLEWLEYYEDMSISLYGYDSYCLYVVDDGSGILNQGDTIYAIEGQIIDSIANLNILINSYNNYYNVSESPLITISVLQYDEEGNATTVDYSIDFSLLSWIII